MDLVSIGQEPSHVRLLIGEGARLAQRKLIPSRIVAALACAVEHRRQHAFAKLRQQRPDIQFALYPWLEGRSVLARWRILQVVECPAIGKRRRKRSELEWGYLNAFTKAGHTRDAALRRRSRWKRARMLVWQIVAGELSDAQEPRVS